MALMRCGLVDSVVFQGSSSDGLKHYRDSAFALPYRPAACLSHDTADFEIIVPHTSDQDHPNTLPSTGTRGVLYAHREVGFN